MKLSRLLLALGIIFLILFMPNVFALNTWTTKTTMPTARGQAAVIAGDDGLIYVMGGFAGGQELATVEAYNPTLDTWVTKASMPQATRGAAVAKGLNGTIYVFGGSGPTGVLNTTQIYDPVTNTWTLGASMPTGQWGAGAATGNDSKIVHIYVYVIGGEEQFTSQSSNKVQRYDPSTDTWTLRAPMPTARRELGVIKGSDGLIYAIGGYKKGALSTVEAYDPSTDTWVNKTSMPKARVWFGLTYGGKIYAIGGGNGTSYLSTNEEFVTDVDGKIYVIGGGTSLFNNYPPVFNTVFAYDPSTDTWTSMPDPMPTARRELGAVAIPLPSAPPPSVPPPSPFWTQWWLWAIIGGIVIIALSAVILMKRKKPEAIEIAPPEQKPVG